MAITKPLIEHVVNTLVGEEALPIVWYLRGKTRISEFIIAEELELEIHRTRNLLYRLLEHNIVFFHRKKDKIKGWYICYWDFNENIIEYLIRKIRREKLTHLQERLAREEHQQFYMCRNACVRMDFSQAIEFNFKCPECGEIKNLQDNTRTIQFLKERIKELEEEDKQAEEERKQQEQQAAADIAAATKREEEAALAKKKKVVTKKTVVVKEKVVQKKQSTNTPKKKTARKKQASTKKKVATKTKK